MGPGRYSAIRAEISLKLSGRSCLSRLCIPSESSWKTPRVCPEDRSSYVALSSMGIWAISTWPLPFASILLRASLITVRLASPRKSIFTSPRVSHVWYSKVVVIVPSVRLSSGEVFVIGCDAIMVAHACTPVWRISPSIPFAFSVIFCTSGFPLYKSRNS